MTQNTFVDRVEHALELTVANGQPVRFTATARQRREYPGRPSTATRNSAR